jgi:hypothetical protein
MLACGLAALAFAFVAPSPAGAKAGRTAAVVVGYARAGHFAPGKGPVDLIVDGQVAAKGLTYKHVTPYLPVPAGTHSFALRTMSGQTVLSVRAGVPANGAVTIGAVTTRSGLAGNVYDDSLQTPKPGTALVRFVHTAPAASKVDISIAGGPTLKDVGYPSATPYQSVKAGTYTIDVRDAASGKVLLQINRWKATSGTQSSIVLVNTEAGKLDAVPFIDSTGSAAAPQGGMATGLGGTAVRPTDHSGWLTASSATLLGTVVFAAAAAGWLTMRRRRVE